MEKFETGFAYLPTRVGTKGKKWRHNYTWWNEYEYYLYYCPLCSAYYEVRRRKGSEDVVVVRVRSADSWTDEFLSAEVSLPPLYSDEEKLRHTTDHVA